MGSSNTTLTHSPAMRPFATCAFSWVGGSAPSQLPSSSVFSPSLVPSPLYLPSLSKTSCPTFTLHCPITDSIPYSPVSGEKVHMRSPDCLSWGHPSWESRINTGIQTASGWLTTICFSNVVKITYTLSDLETNWDQKQTSPSTPTRHNSLLLSRP